MTDLQFVEAVQQVYRTELERGRSAAEALRAAHHFRSGLRIAQATQCQCTSCAEEKETNSWLSC